MYTPVSVLTLLARLQKEHMVCIACLSYSQRFSNTVALVATTEVFVYMCVTNAFLLYSARDLQFTAYLVTSRVCQDQYVLYYSGLGNAVVLLHRKGIPSLIVPQSQSSLLVTYSNLW